MRSLLTEIGQPVADCFDESAGSFEVEGKLVSLRPHQPLMLA